MPGFHPWLGMMRTVNENERRAVARILSLRQYRQMTQQQLAEASGMTRMAVSNVESGKRHLRLGEAVALCTALGVEIGAVVSDAPMTLRVDVQFD